MITQKIKSTIRDVPDFPKKGIIFKDITPIFYDTGLCKDIVNEFSSLLANYQIDAVAGIESRGFLFGTLLAQRLNVPFITVRKKGKLPYKTISYEYALEYGTATIEMHIDAVKKNWNVLIHDDLLATGGTAVAAAELIRKLDANIAGFAFLVELSFLKGMDKIMPYSDNIVSLVSY